MAEPISEQIPHLFSLQEATTEPEPKWYQKYMWLIGVGILTFVGGLVIINSYLQRRAVINQIKNSINYTIKSLNQSGWDAAYDEVAFRPVYPGDLVRFKNLTFYRPDNADEFSIKMPELIISSGFINAQTFDVRFPQGMVISSLGQEHKVSFENYDFSAEASEGQLLNNIIWQAENIKISGWADIAKISLASRIIAPQQINDQSPFFKIYLEAENIKLNGLLDYPLSQNIDRVYLESDVIGQIKAEDNFMQALNSWLARGGNIEIRNMTLNWLPLIMVAKGNLYFNDNLKPIVRLNTSSKALLELLDELDNKKWLDSKGIFVAKILLGSKAYKAAPEDKYLTVTSPITIQEDALLIEKIAVKKWKNK